MWTMANSSISTVRTAMAKFGLCADEFKASAHWPPALYVRSARRLVGERIFTQLTPKEQSSAGSIGNLSIGVGCYNFDSHNAERWACTNKSMCDGAAPHNVNDSTPYIWNGALLELVVVSIVPIQWTMT